ncbi:hypothetical protein BGZ93_009694 [Podila epicladia]|nr:hypothetical protein BGZ92_004359 [Podila epicladia]KAG0089755.1 hypothetical protein BGZ93_009694 [Podila epicladia]
MTGKISGGNSDGMPYSSSEVEYYDFADDTTSTHPSQSRQSRGLSFFRSSSVYSTAPSLKRSSASASISSLAKDEKIPAPSTHSSEPTTDCNEKTSNNSDSFFISDDQEFEYETDEKPYKAPFYKRKRFWWICSGSTAVFLCIFIPILIVYIIPALCQFIMDSSTMSILQLNMTEPQERQIKVSVDAAIVGIPTIFAAKVEFLEPIQVFWMQDSGQQPKVGLLSLGMIDKKAGEKARFVQSTTFQIMDPVLFGEFAKVMIASDSFLWRMTAKINVSVLGRTIKDLNLDKKVSLNGLANFSNLKILAFDIPSDAPNGSGALVTIEASIANPSPIGMSLGTMTLDMGLQTAYLGQVVARNVTLIGGQPTVLKLQGMIRKQTDPAGLQELSTMISNYLANKPTSAYGKGVSVLPDGVNSVSWITTAIVATKLSIPLLPPKPLNVIKDIAIKDLNLVMTVQQPWSPTVSSTGIGALFQLPFNLSLNITNIWDPVLTLGYHGMALTDITAAVWNKTNSDMTHNNISFSLPASPMVIKDDAHDAFGDFLVEVTQQDTTGFEILGSAKSTAITSIGNVNINVPFNTTLALQGINFSKLKPRIDQIIVVGATVDHMLINATVYIDNPSIFAVEAGPATLYIDATVKGVTEYIGDVQLPNLKLSPGTNALQAKMIFKPKNLAFRDNFFTEYILGTDFSASIYGDANSTPVASLTPIMTALKMSTAVPGMHPAPKIIVEGRGNTSVGQVMGQHEIQIQVQVFNPLATQLWIHELSSNVTWRGFPFGNIHISQSFPIRPSGIDTSPLLTIQIPNTFQFWTFIVTQFLPANLGVLTGAFVYVDLTAVIMVTIDGNMDTGYKAGLTYGQKGVAAFLQIAFDLTGLIRKRMVKRSEEYEDVMKEVEAIGPEPSRENGEEYLEWLTKAVDVAFPEAMR